MKSLLLLGLGLLFFVSPSHAGDIAKRESILNATLESTTLTEPTKEIIKSMLSNNPILVSDIAGLSSIDLRDKSSLAYDEVRVFLKVRKLTLDMEPFEIANYLKSGRLIKPSMGSRVDRLLVRRVGILELRKIGIRNISQIPLITDEQWAAMEWAPAKTQILVAVENLKVKPKAVAQARASVTRAGGPLKMVESNTIAPALRQETIREAEPIKIATPATPVTVTPKKIVEPSGSLLNKFSPRKITEQELKQLHEKNLFTVGQLRSKTKLWLSRNFEKAMVRRLVAFVKSTGGEILDDDLEVAIETGDLSRAIDVRSMVIPRLVRERWHEVKTVKDLMDKIEQVAKYAVFEEDPELQDLKARIDHYRFRCMDALNSVVE